MEHPWLLSLAMLLGAFFFWLGQVMVAPFLSKPKTVAPVVQTIPLYEIESRVRDQVRKEAATAGVAFYELNQTTGKIEFHYVDIQKIIRSVVSQMQNMHPNTAGVLQ